MIEHPLSPEQGIWFAIAVLLAVIAVRMWLAGWSE